MSGHGPAVLVGHVDPRRGPAVFFRVQPPDVRGGRRGAVPKDAFPTGLVYGPTADPQLRLITCGGSFDRSARSCLDDIIVYASLSGHDPDH